MPKLGYLLPTREGVMKAILKPARCRRWPRRPGDGASTRSGSALTARPRHEPLALLAAVAGNNERHLDIAAHIRRALGW